MAKDPFGHRQVSVPVDGNSWTTNFSDNQDDTTQTHKVRRMELGISRDRTMPHKGDVGIHDKMRDGRGVNPSKDSEHRGASLPKRL